MGIETILIVFGLIAVIAIGVGAMRGQRKVQEHTHPAPPPPRR